MHYRSEIQNPLHSRILGRWMGRAALCFLVILGLGLSSFQANAEPVNDGEQADDDEAGAHEDVANEEDADDEVIERRQAEECNGIDRCQQLGLEAGDVRHDLVA